MNQGLSLAAVVAQDWQGTYATSWICTKGNTSSELTIMSQSEGGWGAVQRAWPRGSDAAASLPLILGACHRNGSRDGVAA